MILSFDGLDVRWEQAVDWNGVDGHQCFQDLGRTINIKVGTEWIKRLRLRVDATLDLSRNEDRNNSSFISVTNVSKRTIVLSLLDPFEHDMIFLECVHATSYSTVG